MINGYIYHLHCKGEVVYVGKTKSRQGIFSRALDHSANGKVFDSISSYPVYDSDINEVETDDIIKINPKYNKIISSTKNYIKKQSALDKIANSIKRKSNISKLNGSVYYETKFIDAVIDLIEGMK